MDAVTPPEHKDNTPAAEHCRCNPRNHNDRKSSPSLPPRADSTVTDTTASQGLHPQAC